MINEHFNNVSSEGKQKQKQDVRNEDHSTDSSTATRDAEHLTKVIQLTFKLRTNPTNANSATYELTVAYFCTGTPEEWLLVRKAILEVCTGQNLTTGPNMIHA